MKIRNLDEIIETNTIVKHYGGSIAYGTNIETSDVDIRGIFIADPINILTPFFPIKEKSDDTQDNKLYEFHQYMKLYTQANPNIVETLWVDESDIITSSNAYQQLKNYRQDLLSSKIAFTTTGYAYSQLKRIRSANKHVKYQVEFKMLMDILQCGLKDKLIDINFIKRECGNLVYEYMREKNLL